MPPTREQVLQNIANAAKNREDAEFNMATLPNTVTVEDIAAEVKRQTGRDVLQKLKEAHINKESVLFPFSTGPYTPEQMQEKPVEDVSYLNAISKGLMQEPLPPGQSLGKKIVHGAYEELPPTLGAAFGAPLGPAGAMAGAMMGRGVQKGIGAAARALTGAPAVQETPIQMASDVALTGVLQGIGVKGVGTGAADEVVTGGLTARLRHHAPNWPSGPKSGAQARQLIRGSLSETPIQTLPATQPSGVIGGLRAGQQGSKNLAVSEVNALLKPKTVNYVYGKNPGKAVIDEGITGKTFEEIHGQLENKLEEVGKLYEPVLAAHQKVRINVDAFTNPLDVAMAKARRNPRTNKALITRLENAKRDLRMELDNEMTGEALPGAGSFKKMSPKDALELKRAIGEITKFTADIQEDNIVNAALKQSYHMVDNKLDLAVPGIKQLNERWANLLGATVAARNKAMMGMNKRQWVAPVAEVMAGAGIGAMAQRPLTGAALGAGTALVHKLAQSPSFTIGSAHVLNNQVASGFGAAAQGLEKFAATQIPQTGIRRGLEYGIESDPLGLFDGQP